MGGLVAPFWQSLAVALPELAPISEMVGVNLALWKVEPPPPLEPAQGCSAAPPRRCASEPTR